MSKKAQFAVRKFQNFIYKASDTLLQRGENIDDVADEKLAELLECA